MELYEAIRRVFRLEELSIRGARGAARGAPPYGAGGAGVGSPGAAEGAGAARAETGGNEAR